VTTSCLDDTRWMSLMPQIPFAWNRNEAAFRRFVEVAL
jgi:hypothetical protein